MQVAAKAKQNNRLYWQLLLSFILIAVITVLVFASVLSISFQQILINKIYSAQEDTLHSATFSLDDSYQSVKSLMLQIYFDNDISMLRYLGNPDVEEITTSMKRLGLYSAILPNVKSLYIYSDVSKSFYDIIPYGPRTIYSFQEFYDDYAKNMVSSTDETPNIYPLDRVFPVVDGTGAISQVNGYTFFYMNKPHGNGPGEGAIIINVSDTWVQDIIGRYNSPFSSNTYIIDDTGKIVFSNSDAKNSKDFLNFNLIKSKFGENTQSGYYLAKNGTGESIVIYSQYKTLSWMLVRVIPLNDIKNEVNKVWIEAILIGIVVLVIGGLAAFLLSKRVYKPIDRLLRQVKDLESENNSAISIKKRELLREIVLGVNQDADKLITNMRLLECQLDPAGYFILIHLSIDRYTEHNNTYNAVEREKLKSAIIIMSSQICSKYFKNESLDIDECHSIFLVSVSDHTLTDPIGAVSRIAFEIQSSIRESIGISVSFALSPLVEDLASIPYAYNEVKKLSMEKFFTGSGSLLRPDTIHKINFNNYKHPADNERKLTEYLLAGDLEKTKQMLNEILDGLSPFTFYTMRLELLRLTANCFTALNLVEKNKGISLSYSFERFISDIESMESLTEVKDYFFRFFQSVIIDLDENRLNRQNDLVKRIVEIVQKNYMDVNLSLFSIAEEIGMSSAYLGRTYKKLTSSSVLDCINNVRAAKAQELLVATNKSIKEICAETGYTNNQHFYRVFRKATGVTPAEFRSKHATPRSSIQ